MSSAPSPIPPDDPKRSLTVAQPDNLPHIGLVGDTYTITVTGEQTAGRFCVIDMQTAADHQSAFASEGQSGFAADAAVGASDNANFPRKPVWHGSHMQASNAPKRCVIAGVTLSRAVY